MLGLVGACLLTLGGIGVGALPGADHDDPWPLAGPVRLPDLPPFGALPSLVAFYGGLALLVRALLSLRRAQPGLREALVVVALWWAPLLLGPPLCSLDAYAYVAQGEVARRGEDPYTVAPSSLPPGPVRDSVDTRWLDDGSPYGPLAMAAGRLAASAPGPQPVSGVLALRAVAIASLAAACALAGLLAQRLRKPAGDAVVLLGGNPLSILHIVGGVHYEALMAVMLLAALLSARHRRPVLAAAFIGVAAAVKAPAILALPFLAIPPARSMIGTKLRGGWVAGAARAGAAAAVALLAVTWLVGLNLNWVRNITGGARVLSFLAPTTWLTGLLRLFGAPPSGAQTFAMAVGLVVALVTVAVLHRRPGSGIRERRLGLALVAVPLLAPVLQPWYLLWGLGVLAGTEAGRRNRRVLLGSIVLAFLTHPGGRGHLTAAGPVGLALGVALIFLGVVPWWRLAQSDGPFRTGGDEAEVAPAPSGDVD